MKESTTMFDGTYLIYKCPHCGMKSGSEPADPKKNPDPFSFLPNCKGCGAPKEIDWDVIDAAHASFKK